MICLRNTVTSREKKSRKVELCTKNNLNTAILCGSKIFPALLLIAGLLFLASCASDSPGKTYTEKLQEMINNEWQSYTATHANWGGGASLYITTPAENYFVYTGYPAGKVMTPATHFRAASTTKTFTAASIMQLHQ